MHNSDYNKKEERRLPAVEYPGLVKKLARARVFLEELSSELTNTALAPTLGISRQAIDKHVEKARKEIQTKRSAPKETLPTNKK